MKTQQLLHTIKRPVLRSSPVHAWLRRRVLTPYQLRQYRRLAKLLPRPSEAAGSRPRVLVLALRHWALSRAWEAVLTRYLDEAGAEVVWLHCEQAMQRCDSMMTADLEPELCRHCVDFNRDVADSVGVSTQSLASHVNEREGDAEGEDGVVRASLQRMLRRRVPHQLSPGEAKIRAELVNDASRARRAARRLFDAERFDAVIALNGKFFSERVILEEAATAGIPVWTYERGNRKDSLILSRSMCAVPFDTTSIVETLDKPLTAHQQERIDDYLMRRRLTGNGQVSFASQRSKLLELPREDGPVVALFTNLVWDSAVVGEDTIFDDMFEWIESVVVSMAGSRKDLVIRVHPAETRIYWHATSERTADVLTHRFPSGLPPNVHLIGPDDPVDTYDLIDVSDVVLTYTSTVGLEAACVGKRVIVAAHSNYSDAPFVERPDSKDAYLEAIHAGGSRPHPGVGSLARRFAYRLYFERMIDVPFVAENPTGFRVRDAHRGEAAMRDQACEIVRSAKGITPT